MEKEISIKILLIGNYSIDAIDHYCNLIGKGLSKAYNQNFVVVHSINEVNKGDIVVVIDAKSHFLLWLKRKNNKIFSWFQGILPEENKMNNPNFNLVNYFRIIWWEFLEKFSLRLSYCNIFVSNQMKHHFSTKYFLNLDKKKNIIIPCYNKPFKENSFNVGKRYETPSFVYAGSLAGWQCIEQTIEIFKELKNKINNAKLIILTNEVEKGIELVDKNNLNNVEVKYVPYEYVDEELQKYKYGFLLRESHVVNEVSTPTKMNTYLSNGLIPIFTNSIGYYKDKFTDLDYKIMLNANFSNDLEENVNSILTFENQKIDINKITAEFSNFCYKNYNDEVYINDIIKL